MSARNVVNTLLYLALTLVLCGCATLIRDDLKEDTHKGYCMFYFDVEDTSWVEWQFNLQVLKVEGQKEIPLGTISNTRGLVGWPVYLKAACPPGTNSFTFMLGHNGVTGSANVETGMITPVHVIMTKPVKVWDPATPGTIQTWTAPGTGKIYFNLKVVPGTPVDRPSRIKKDMFWF